ncbi:MAG TPA: glycosyltransferase, partial [Bacteroidia bacterium]
YLLNEKIKDVSNIQIVENLENIGKARSIHKGVDLAETEYICFADGDLAYSLDHIHALVQALGKFDLVIGNRSLSENHLRNKTRHVFGETFNRMVRMMLNMNFTDTQAGLKGFRKEIAKKLFKVHLINNFAFDAELLYIARLKGFSIGQIPAKVNEYHQFRPSNVKLLVDSPKMFLSLLKIIFYRLTGRYNE